MSIWKFWKRPPAPVEAPAPVAKPVKIPTAIDILAEYTENCRLTYLMLGMTNTAHLDPIQKADLHRRYGEASAEYLRAQMTLEQALAERGGE
jgi:hypothetical protein